MSKRLWHSVVFAAAVLALWGCAGESAETVPETSPENPVNTEESTTENCRTRGTHQIRTDP